MLPITALRLLPIRHNFFLGGDLDPGEEGRYVDGVKINTTRREMGEVISQDPFVIGTPTGDVEFPYRSKLSKLPANDFYITIKASVNWS